MMNSSTAPFSIHVLATPLAGGCLDLRITEPFQAISRAYDIPLAIHIPRDRGYTIPTVTRPSIFIYHRRALDRVNALPLLQKLHREGHLILAEFDDHPNLFPSQIATDYFGLRAMHAVMVSTLPLARVVKPLNPTVGIFPNQIANLAPLTPPRNDGQVRILWAALNRGPEGLRLAAMLARVLASRPQAEMTVIHDRAVFEAIDSPRKRFLPLLSYQDYKAQLGLHDIMVMPLDDTETNRCKSDLKFIEAAATGVVALASPTVYADSLLDGKTGLLFRNEEEFVIQLTQLIDDAGLRVDLRQAAWDYVARERQLALHIPARFDWLCARFNERAELDAILLEREPIIKNPQTMPKIS